MIFQPIMLKKFASFQKQNFVKNFSKSSTTFHGGLSDADRIFTNLYGEYDVYLDGALKRGLFLIPCSH
jgi:NADH dehydrogenase (ubiquinone) flavoprotein 1